MNETSIGVAIVLLIVIVIVPAILSVYAQKESFINCSLLTQHIIDTDNKLRNGCNELGTDNVKECSFLFLIRDRLCKLNKNQCNSVCNSPPVTRRSETTSLSRAMTLYSNMVSEAKQKAIKKAENQKTAIESAAATEAQRIAEKQAAEAAARRAEAERLANERSIAAAAEAQRIADRQAAAASAAAREAQKKLNEAAEAARRAAEEAAKRAAEEAAKRSESQKEQQTITNIENEPAEDLDKHQQATVKDTDEITSQQLQATKDPLMFNDIKSFSVTRGSQKISDWTTIVGGNSKRTIKLAEVKIGSRTFYRVERHNFYGSKDVLTLVFKQGDSFVTQGKATDHPYRKSDGTLNINGLLEYEYFQFCGSEGCLSPTWKLRGLNDSRIIVNKSLTNSEKKSLQSTNSVNGYTQMTQVGDGEELLGQYMMAPPLHIGKEYSTAIRGAAMPEGKAMFHASSVQECADRCNQVGACGAFTYYQKGGYYDTGRKCKLMGELWTNPPRGYLQPTAKEMVTYLKDTAPNPPIPMPNIYGNKKAHDPLLPLDSWNIDSSKYNAKYQFQPPAKYGQFVNAANYDAVFVRQDPGKSHYYKTYVRKGNKNLWLQGGYGQKNVLTEYDYQNDKGVNEPLVLKDPPDNFFINNLVGVSARPSNPSPSVKPTAERSVKALKFKNTSAAVFVGMKEHIKLGTSYHNVIVNSITIQDYSGGRSVVKMTGIDLYNNSTKTFYMKDDGNDTDTGNHDIATTNIVAYNGALSPPSGYQSVIYIKFTRNGKNIDMRSGKQGIVGLYMKVSKSGTNWNYQIKSKTLNNGGYLTESQNSFTSYAPSYTYRSWFDLQESDKILNATGTALVRNNKISAQARGQWGYGGG
ncbi:PAN domain-containing protein [Tetraselmis virus 1]|uniref:PAN domain-containing protein n=1 Tax=Tetraselmis virus 1 TaxID=2060617 RepID=A0A2P0VNJ5_9VIRU|nr:PAN domain-containing protein [Tetraselmis virus 1]AUF82440.1 PAN domain-containing protein [Tetraselmis virus 1]